MHYELYLDSMFLLNLGMNLLLLIMVDHSTCRTATWYRLLWGAGIGAVCYLLPFLWKGAALLKLLLCMLPGTLLMLTVTFRIRNWHSLWSYFRKQMYDTFLLGGILVAVLRGIPAGIQYVPGVVFALGMGTFAVRILLWRYQRESEDGVQCKVVLRGREQTLCITAIVDSGNTLTEPYERSPRICTGCGDISDFVAGGTAEFSGDSLPQCREKEWNSLWIQDSADKDPDPWCGKNMQRCVAGSK